MPSVVKLPGTVGAIPDGDWAWTNTSNALSDSDSAARAAANISNGSFPNTQSLTLTNFGFAIPSTAVISGLLLELSLGRAGSFAMFVEAIAFINAGSDFAAAGQSLNLGDPDHNGSDAYGGGLVLPNDGSLAMYSYGGSNSFPPNQTAVSVPPSVINSSTFGVRLKGFGNQTGGRFDVDFARITVTYDFAGTDLQGLLLRGVSKGGN